VCDEVGLVVVLYCVDVVIVLLKMCLGKILCKMMWEIVDGY